LEHQPLRDSRLAFFVLGQQLAGLARQVQQDRADFKYGEVAVATVHDRRNAAIGADGKKLRLFLVACAQINLMDVVRQPDLLQKHGYFPAIRRGSGVQVDLGRTHADISAERSSFPDCCAIKDASSTVEILERLVKEIAMAWS
jgi:hypothetical protein